MAKKAKRHAKTGVKSKAPRRVKLAGFFRKLWSKPELMEKFSSSPAGRAEVLAQFNLSGAHKKLISEGCVRDIMQELAGFKPRTESSSVLVCDDDGEHIDCGHPECKAFVATLRQKR